MILYKRYTLEELGITDGINEIIATTEKEGTINAAPLGIIRNENSLHVRLFNGSHTYDNILANQWFVANITHDPWLFAETALSDLSQNHFVRIEGLPVLRDAEAWALFRCEAFQLNVVLAKIELIKGDLLKKSFRAFNRGANLVIEASIAATRYMALGSDNYYEELLRLRRIIDRCGGARERMAMDRIMSRVESFSHI
jgi:hypothetical protein